MISAIQRLGAIRPALPDFRHWPAVLVLVTTFSLYLLAAFSVTSGSAAASRADAHGLVLTQVDSVALPPGPPPVPEPLAFRDMSADEAAAYNASIPLSVESNPAARPFLFRAASEIDQARALDCLTAAVYYEAAGEPTEGQRAVAQVVLNRVRHPAFPKSVCGVVFQGSERSTGCQFTFTCDGSMVRVPSEAGWARARKVAEEALGGKVYAPVGYATHYHTVWVVPYWSETLTKLANVGAHIFYRWEGGWGRPPAFRYAATGSEPTVSLMSRLSSVPPELPATDVAQQAMLAQGQVTPADLAGRPVVRHYEPLREESAAAARADLDRADVPQSLRWALTGETAPSAPALRATPAEPVVIALPPLPAAAR